MPALKSWLEEARPQFLLASLVSVFVGVSLVVYEGFTIKLFDFALATTGALVAHVGIHAFNDYSDFVTGIDQRVHRTPFSGGSGVLPAGKLQPNQVYYFGISCLVIVVSIGIYFVATAGVAILPVGLLGVALMYYYTSHLTRRGLGELGTGVGFSLWSIGTYFVQTGQYSLSIFLVSLIPSLMGVALLLLNELPDVEADKFGGRRNIPIIFGPKHASRIYSLLIVSAYVWLPVLVITRVLPVPALLALVTLPLGVRVITLALRQYGNAQAMMDALRLNAVLVLTLPFLVSVGTIVGSAG